MAGALGRKEKSPLSLEIKTKLEDGCFQGREIQNEL